mgnify:CR=1 FL=1
MALLIAQAIAENHQIVSADAVFDLYPVERIWEEPAVLFAREYES